VANLSVGFSVATINVSVDYSANPDAVTKLLKDIAMDVRNSAAFKDVFLDDPQVLGLDSMKGSQTIFPVIFKTRATQQYGPMREFQRRVRLALEEHHLLPGDPNRVFNSFLPEAPENRQAETGSAGSAGRVRSEPETTQAHDPTTLKPHDGNPFSGE
jgi:small conductance mechanosensitive channel